MENHSKLLLYCQHMQCGNSSLKIFPRRTEVHFLVCCCYNLSMFIIIIIIIIIIIVVVVVVVIVIIAFVFAKK